MEELEQFRELVFNRMERGIFGQDVPAQKINDVLGRNGFRTFDLWCSVCRSEMIPYVYRLLKEKDKSNQK